MPDNPKDLEGNIVMPVREFGRIPSPTDKRDWDLDDFIPPKLTLDIPKNKSWEFPLDPLDQEETPHCFTGETLIKMADGCLKPINEISVGDTVVSAEGNSRAVTEIMARDYGDKLVKIKLWGHNMLECTPEHPILTKRGYIKAIELNKDDFIAMPRYKESEEEYLYFEDVVGDANIPTNFNTIKDKIRKTYSLGRLFGIYLAEGYCEIEKGRISMAFNINERYTLVQETLNTLKDELGIDANLTIRKKSHTIVLGFHGKYLAQFFANLFGEGAENKGLSKYLNGNNEFKRGILEGWLAGDGHFRRTGWQGVTVSKKLALDMFSIANDLGYMPVVSESTPNKNKWAKSRKTRYDVSFGIATDETNGVSRGWRMALDENCTWRKVRKIEFDKKYTGKVYNLEVEKDHSYIADGIGVHNCVGFSGAHFGINLPTLTVYTAEDAHNFYYECKKIDGNPTGEDGTTLRSLAKVFQNLGVINNYAFAGDLDSIKTWVLTKGPVIMGTIWTEGMMRPNEQGILDISGFILGGHAYIVNEWDVKEGYVTILNSWGKNWGIDGRAYISIDDFKSIFLYGGEALAAVEIENYKTKNEGWFASLIKNLLEIIKRLFSQPSS